MPDWYVDAWLTRIALPKNTRKCHTSDVLSVEFILPLPGLPIVEG